MPVAGLHQGSTYYFRVVASYSLGTLYGEIGSFTTLPASPPSVSTNPTATNVTSFEARVAGTVNPNGLDTTVGVEYGTTTSYEHGWGLPAPLKAKYSTESVLAGLPGLAPATVYHYRFVATNALGKSFGADATFKTQPLLPPAVSTNGVTEIKETTAVVHCLINPNGTAAAVNVEYGKTSGLGSWGGGEKVGSGTANVAFSSQIGGLSPGSTYYYRCEGNNAVGKTYGSMGAFQTQATPPPPPPTGGGGTTSGGGTTPYGDREVKVWNCESAGEELSLYKLDTTTNSAAEKVGSQLPDWSNGLCGPGIGSPMEFTPADKNWYDFAAYDSAGQSVFSDVVEGDPQGPTLECTVPGGCRLGA
jgi:hypothetical protein